MIKKFQIAKDEAGVSLLQLIRHKLNLSNKRVKEAVSQNACFVNEKIEKFTSYKVRVGDRVLLHLDRFEEKEIALKEILYEDSSLIAYNKPPFFVCDETCNIHRLDKETSGVILQSKRDKKAFLELFRERKIDKTYFAIVEGEMKKAKGEIVSSLGVVQQFQGQKVMGNTKRGALSKTEWVKVAVKHGLTLVKCFPKTGRTHQIRVHLASIGHPILGDYQYGALSKRAKRILLHAYSVSFIHPKLGKEILIQAPIPSDFLELFDEDLYC